LDLGVYGLYSSVGEPTTMFCSDIVYNTPCLRRPCHGRSRCLGTRWDRIPRINIPIFQILFCGVVMPATYDPCVIMNPGSISHVSTSLRTWTTILESLRHHLGGLVIWQYVYCETLLMRGVLELDSYTVRSEMCWFLPSFSLTCHQSTIVFVGSTVRGVCVLPALVVIPQISRLVKSADY
jgi:hypothetical protein